MKNKKILIVEDESLVALDIKNCLEELSFQVTGLVKNMEKTLLSIKNNRPDLVLLDINLNKESDGIDIAQKIKDNYNIPIIFLTAYSDENTLLRASQTNPDAYLNKPFRIDDLKTGILLSLNKKNLQKNQPILLSSKYKYDYENHTIFYEDEILKLSQNETKLLYLLVQAKGNVVYYSQIEEHIWSDEYITNDTLRALVYRLRHKLKDLEIQTISAIGYKLII